LYLDLVKLPNVEWKTKIFSRKLTNFPGEILEKLCYGITVHLDGENFCFGDVV
jgi:hypothetical protein